jgi:hypothetical protein
MTTANTLRIALFLAASPVLAQQAETGPAPWRDPSEAALSAAGAQAKAVVTSTPIATQVKYAVRNAYNALYAPAMPPMNFTGSVASCTPGTIGLAFKEATLSRVNYFRAMAGLPGNVTLDTDPTRENQQQAAAVIYSANTLLTHDINSTTLASCSQLKPVGDPAGRSSNIAIACGSGAAGDDVIPRYMDDGGSGNEAAGHRRWILYPPQAAMTVGSTPTTSCSPGGWGGNALRVFLPEGARPATPNGVAWPPAGFVPTQVLPGSGRWSYSLPNAGFSAATVSLTANGAPVGVSIISNTANYGDPAIVFVPATSIVAGTSYTVTINNILGGGAPSSVTYTVKPFDATQPVPVTNDLNADGKADILFQNADGRIAAWTQNGLATTGSANLIGAGGGWSVTHTADLSGDGKSDIVFKHADGRVYVYTMNGVTVTGGKELLGPGLGWSVSHIADLNGDGKADLILRHVDGRAHVWLMDGTAIIGGGSLLPAATGWTAVATGDMNGDGRADIAFMHADGRGYVYLMNGATITGGAGFLSPGSGWTATHLGDINGDGRADLFFRHADGRAYVYLMNGTTFGAGTELLPAGAGWQVTHLGDVNGDGKADIVFRNVDGRAHVRLMNGIATLAGTDVLPAASGWTLTQLLDFNGDGRQDLVFRHADGSIVARLMNGLTALGSATLVGPGGWSVVPPQ